MAAVALLLTGCVAGDTTDDGGGPRRDLAAKPSSLPPEPPPVVGTPSPGGSASGRPASPGASSGGAGSSASARPSAGASGAPGGSVAATASASAPSGGGGPGPGPGAPYAQVGRATDKARDPGAGVPGYGDLVAVTVEDDGTNARVTVTMNADVPLRLSAEETMGVGVDFFRSAAQVESDYQLFADGEPDGWYAYLQGPKGFVKYPGTFGVGGRRLVFTVPWSALGAPRAGRFSAFADWTRTAIPSNQFGEDHAPDLGTAAFTR